MAHNPPRGPGKGPGNGSAAKPFGTAQDAKVASEKGVAERITARERMRRWTEAHPDAEKKPETLSRKAIRFMLEDGAPDALQRLHDEMTDPTSPKGVEAAKHWLDHTIGKPMQGVELSGPEGGEIQIGVIRRVIVDPGNNDGGAPANAPNPGNPDT